MQKTTDNMGETMEVGVACVDITPDTPISLAGFAARSRSETDKVRHQLSAKALAFGSDAQGPSIFIVVDLAGIQWRITKKLVKQLSEQIGIRPEQVVLCATHTHGSPETGNLMNTLQCRGDYPVEYGFSDSLLDLEKLIHIATYNELLNRKLVEVALAALKSREPAFVTWGVGEASFAVNRRTEGGPVDHSLPVLFVTDPDGMLRAVLVNYACHGIALGPDVNEIHGDWMGVAQNAIERKYPGAVALISIGCAGDAHPKSQGKMEYLELYGQEISDNVSKLLRSELHPLTSPPTGHMKWVELPFSKLPDIGELIELTKDPSIKGYFSRLELERIIRGYASLSELAYPIQTWNFGGQLLMINMGGEVVADYAIRLKKELGGDRLWINSYSNDVPCYIPSRRILKEGGYEADASMYWYNKPAPFSEEIEDRIMDTVHEMIRDHRELKK